jgi:hypothetical protein
MQAAMAEEDAREACAGRPSGRNEPPEVAGPRKTKPDMLRRHFPLQPAIPAIAEARVDIYAARDLSV